MPESMSIERRKMLALLGAELVLTPATLGMKGAIAKANEIVAATPGAIIPQQFENPANPEIHRRTTAEEIWNDTNGEVDIFVSGVGTGGTITGVGQVLKARKPGVRIDRGRARGFARPVGRRSRARTRSRASAPVSRPRCSTAPSSTRSSPSAIRPPSTRRVWSRRLEGIPVGISSGAAIAAAIDIGRRPENAGKKIV